MSPNLFCEKCNRQLQSISEIEKGICNDCQLTLLENAEKKNFLCWACKKALYSKKEIAQGVCESCKADIIRILK